MKKACALFFVVFLFLLTGPLHGERRGAEVTIEKNDGRKVSGELIAVKEDTLLLKESQSGADVSIGVDELEAITIEKKSRALLGAGIGFLSGGVMGAFAGAAAHNSNSGKFQIFSTKDVALVSGLIVGVLGSIVGAGIGGMAGKDELMSFKGRSESAIRADLRRLRNKARVPGFQ